jgi:carbonic anhydrase
MEPCTKLLLANRAWAQERLEIRPEFFKDLAREQKPDFLWIGCSDSRVPAEEVTGASPGELFVHRNIANLVVHTDLNLMSVLQYAVDHLQVKHIIVCGHHGCGGVRAAMSRKSFGLINKWLRSIKDLVAAHSAALEMDADLERRTDRVVELNVVQQVYNLAKTSIVQRAWHEDQRPTLHGWVYELDSGLLKELVTVTPNTRLDDVFMYDPTDLGADE